MDMSHLGQFIPGSLDEDDIVVRRKAKYLQFLRRMTGYSPTPRKLMPSDKEYKILKAAKQGLIPWPLSKSPDEYREHREEKNKEIRESDSGSLREKGPWSIYFYTCFFAIAPKLILRDKNELEEMLKEMKEPVDVSGLPQDGSKGQARACRSYKRSGVEWFLGEWDGRYTEWKEDTTTEESESDTLDPF